ncbi:MAG: FG-GAP repeat protein, partial [Thermoplasmata archaeon]|nr:FG-GAP repeat protein [Thermoplasmata archaeon]
DSANGSKANAGAAYIFFGHSDIHLNNISAALANVTIYGSSPGDNLGWDVSDADDVNGGSPAYSDIIIGAPGNNSNRGNAYIFYGKAKGSWLSSYDASAADVIITGANNGDRFGSAVSTAGNVNGGANNDIIVGAPFNDSYNGSLANAGAAYIFYGEGGSIPTSALNANVSLYGEAAGDLFGHSVSNAGNVNNDNYTDIIVGAPYNDESGTNAGNVYLFYGDPNMVGEICYCDSIEVTTGSGITGTHSNTHAVGGGTHDIDEGDYELGSHYAVIVDAVSDETITEGVNQFGSTYVNTQTDNGVTQDIDEVWAVPGYDYTYDFSTGAGSNKWAYEIADDPNEMPPSSPPTGSAFSSYTEIANSDDIRYSTVYAKKEFPNHNFRFTINEAEADLSQIYVEWEGYATDMGGTILTLYIWNSDTPAWQSVGTGGLTSSDNVISNTYTTSLGSYVDASGYLYLAAACESSPGSGGTFYTDFVEVVITINTYTLNVTYTLDNIPTNRDNYNLAVQASTNMASAEDFTVYYRKDSGSWNILGYIEGTSETSFNISVGAAPTTSVEVRFLDNTTSLTPSNTMIEIDLIHLYCWNNTKYDLNVTYIFDFEMVPQGTIDVSIYAKYTDAGNENVSVWAWDYDETTPSYEDTGINVNSGVSPGYAWTNVTALGNEYINIIGEIKIMYKSDTIIGDLTNKGTLSIDYQDVRNDTFRLANVTLYGDTAGDKFGWSISNCSDINNQNYDDIVIGAPGTTNGTAYVYYGGNLTAPSSSPITNSTDTEFNAGSPTKTGVVVMGDQNNFPGNGHLNLTSSDTFNDSFEGGNLNRWDSSNAY